MRNAAAQLPQRSRVSSAHPLAPESHQDCPLPHPAPLLWLCPVSGPPGRAEAGAGTVDGPLQSSCTTLPLSIAQAGLPAASARQHVSLVCVGTLFLFSLFLAETTQALARSPKQPLGSLPVPSLAMPSETYICCTLTPPMPKPWALGATHSDLTSFSVHLALTPDPSVRLPPAPSSHSPPPGFLLGRSAHSP